MLRPRGYAYLLESHRYVRWCDILHRHATHRCDELRNSGTSDRRQPLTGSRRPVSADCRYLSIIILYSTCSDTPYAATVMPLHLTYNNFQQRSVLGNHFYGEQFYLLVSIACLFLYFLIFFSALLLCLIPINETVASSHIYKDNTNKWR